jgi:hypothetical protein
MSSAEVVSTTPLDDGYWLVLLKIPGQRTRREVVVPSARAKEWAEGPGDLLALAARAVLAEMKANR